MKRVLTGLTALFAVLLLTVVTATSAFATKPEGHKVTICHATPPDTAAQGWHAKTVDVASVGYQHSGHQDQHDADIIPAWSYTDDDGNTFSYAGKNLGDLGAFGYPGVNGSDVLAGGCELPDTPPQATPVTPKFFVNQPTCETPQVLTFDDSIEGLNYSWNNGTNDSESLVGPNDVVFVVSADEGFVLVGPDTYSFHLRGKLTGEPCAGDTPPPPPPPTKKHKYHCTAGEAMQGKCQLNDGGVTDQQLVEDSGSRVQGG